MRASLLAFALLPALATAADTDLPKGVYARLGGAAFQHPDRPLALDFSPDGKHLASGGSDGSVRIWEVAKQRLLYTLGVKGGIVTGLRYTADGKSLFVHFGDEKLRRYDADGTYKLLDATAARHLDHLSASADGSLVAGLETSDKVKVVETKTGLERLELPEGRCACLSPDGSAVAVVTAENGVQVFEVPSGKPLHKMAGVKEEKNNGPGAITFSPDGKRVAVAPEWLTGRVRVYDLGSDKPVGDFDGEGAVRFAGNDTVVARRRGRVVVFDLKAKAVAAEFGDKVGAFAVSADGKWVATDNGGGVGAARLRLWDVAKGTEVRATTDDLSGIAGTAPGPDGSAWLFAADRVYSWKPGDKPAAVATLPKPAVAFTATADAIFVTDGTAVRKLDAKKPAAEPIVLPDFPKGTVHLAASAAGTLIAAVVSEPEQRLVLCDGSGKDVRGWPLPSPALGVAVRPNGASVAALSRDGFVRVWEAGTDPKKPAEKWKTRLSRSVNGGVAFTPDGKAVVVAGMLKVLVLDADDGKQLAVYERTWDDGPFVSVAVSADGSMIAAGSLGTNTVAVWDRDSGAAVARLTGSKTTPWHLSFSGDGRTLLACGGDDAAQAWDITDRRGKAKPTADDLKTAWDALARGPEAAWQAGWVFADAADPWAAIADGTKTARDLFADVDKNAALLGDKDFATRKKAAAALLEAGVVALPAVKAVAEKTDVPEAKRQADELAAKLTAMADDPKGTTGDATARLLRAVKLAEKLGGPKATAALDDLAKFSGEVGKAADEAKKRGKK